jgi:hypothetical protein
MSKFSVGDDVKLVESTVAYLDKRVINLDAGEVGVIVGHADWGLDGHLTAIVAFGEDLLHAPLVDSMLVYAGDFVANTPTRVTIGQKYKDSDDNVFIFARVPDRGWAFINLKNGRSLLSTVIETAVSEEYIHNVIVSHKLNYVEA